MEILNGMSVALTICAAFLTGYRVGIAKGRATAWTAALRSVIGLFNRGEKG